MIRLEATTRLVESLSFRVPRGSTMRELQSREIRRVTSNRQHVDSAAISTRKRLIAHLVYMTRFISNFIVDHECSRAIVLQKLVET